MDLATFLNSYRPDTDLAAPRTDTLESAADAAVEGIDESVRDLLSRAGGMSFSGGIYRTHRLEDVQRWSTTIATGWTETAGRVNCFAYDWLGRQFALYKGNMVLQFSAGDLEFTEIPADVASFHNLELVNYAQEVLARAFFDAWLHGGGQRPRYGACIGYKRALFLGGPDEVENLELIDMDVYWMVSAPIVAKARKVGVGGRIGQVEFDQ